MRCFSRVLAILLLAIAIPIPESSAHDGRNAEAFGIAAGIVGLGLLGAAAEAEARRSGLPYYGASCYPGPRECDYVERPCYYNDFGDEICPAPYRRCYRRPICD